MDDALDDKAPLKGNSASGCAEYVTRKARSESHRPGVPFHTVESQAICGSFLRRRSCTPDLVENTEVSNPSDVGNIRNGNKNHHENNDQIHPKRYNYQVAWNPAALLHSLQAALCQKRKSQNEYVNISIYIDLYIIYIHICVCVYSIYIYMCATVKSREFACSIVTSQPK